MKYATLGFLSGIMMNLFALWQGGSLTGWQTLFAIFTMTIAMKLTDETLKEVNNEEVN